MAASSCWTKGTRVASAESDTSWKASAQGAKARRPGVNPAAQGRAGDGRRQETTTGWFFSVPVQMQLSAPAEPRASEDGVRVALVRLSGERCVGVEAAERLEQDFSSQLLEGDCLPAEEKREPAE